MNAVNRFRLNLMSVMVLVSAPSAFADEPAVKQGDAILKDFKFANGHSLPELRIHYRTIGEPKRGANGVVNNAVLVLHGTTGNGGNFIRKEFSGELFGAGQPLDGSKYFIVLPDGIGHGKSSKPSDGLHAKFPNYGYRDMIAAHHRLLTEALKVDHLRIVIGTSMGGMHCWLWGQTYPDFMDALLPLASLPTEISGRNRMWRRIVIDSIRNDPTWNNGEYTKQPPGLKVAAEMLAYVSGNSIMRQKAAPTLKEADRLIDNAVRQTLRTSDANDVLYAVEASQDYDPGPGLAKIKAPLLAINFADDLINPPELGILESQIKCVPNGRAFTFPASEKTVGHGTHTYAAIWKDHLVDLLKTTEKH